jgi:LysM repeat protein
MTAGSSERRPLKIRRRGRHTSPSQVEKVAAQAGKAAPAVAIAGALVAAPQAQHAPASPGTPASGARQAAHHTAGGRAASAGQPARTVMLDSYSASSGNSGADRTYVVRSGDTLSSIAQRFYHNAADWQWLYHVNANTIADPNLIYAGERLTIPLDPPAHYMPTGYQPRHAKPAGHVTTTATASAAIESDGTRSGATDSGSSDSPTYPSAPRGGTTTDNTGSSSSGGYVPPSGDYSCTDLERLWDAAGGNPGAAFMAAEIAMAESGGNPNAISPTDDYGLWQINASNGALATLNPYKNAQSAIILSGDGRNWDAWTTYTSGAYYGRC